MSCTCLQANAWDSSRCGVCSNRFILGSAWPPRCYELDLPLNVAELNLPKIVVVGPA